MEVVDNPVALNTPLLLQLTEVRVAPQVPEISCNVTPEVTRSDPTELNKIVVELFFGVNLNHTSSSALLLLHTAGDPLAVAWYTVPKTEGLPGIRVTALLQLSFPGGAANNELLNNTNKQSMAFLPAFSFFMNWILNTAKIIGQQKFRNSCFTCFF